MLDHEGVGGSERVSGGDTECPDDGRNVTSSRTPVRLFNVTATSSRLVVRLHVDLMRVCGMCCLPVC